MQQYLKNEKTPTFIAIDAANSNSLNWVTKNIKLSSGKLMVISIWDGLTTYYNPVTFPIKHFAITSSINLKYNDFSVGVKRTDENQIQIITSGNIFVYVVIIE